MLPTFVNVKPLSVGRQCPIRGKGQHLRHTCHTSGRVHRQWPYSKSFLQFVCVLYMFVQIFHFKKLTKEKCMEKFMNQKRIPKQFVRTA